MKSIIRGGPFKRGSQWVSDLLCMCELFENESGWFQNGIGRVVGDGSNTSFWEAKWLEGERLSSRFNRIFMNSEQKYLKFAEVGLWG